MPKLMHWLRQMATTASLWPVRQFCRLYLRRFVAGTDDCHRSQHHTLRNILELGRGSDYLNTLKLDDRNLVHSYRQQAPIIRYRDIAEYVDRARAGDVTGLFRPGTEILMFAMTSGTTGAPKWIPVTNESLAAYRLSWLTWGLAATNDHPLLPFRPALGLASDWCHERTSAGIPCGSITGFLKQQAYGGWFGMRDPCPAQVLRIRDWHDRLYAAALYGVAHADLATITTANPSTLLAFGRLLRDHGDELIADLLRGHSPRVAASLVGLTGPGSDRNRAAHLAGLKAKHGWLAAKHIWPELAMLGVWTGGTLTSYLPSLPEYYGDLPLRDHGLSASEGHFTIPMGDHDASGVLNIEGAYCEFIPLDSDGERTSELVEAHEVERGQEYAMVVTTTGGLYRYDLGDIVRCTGHMGDTPRLIFLHKGREFSSMTGEKLTAWQVAKVGEDLRAEGYDLPAEFVLVPQFADPPYYQLVVADRDAPFEDRSTVVNAFDRALKELNIEYASKRESDRLGPPRWQRVSRERWESLRDDRMVRGARPEQYKHPFLMTNETDIELLLSPRSVEDAG